MADDIEKQKLAEAEAKAKAEADSSLEKEQPDYKALAEANEAMAKAEKIRADAAEALIIKNKEITRRNKDGNAEGEDKPVTKKDLEELEARLKPKLNEESPEEKALKEANENLEKIKIQHAELARAFKSKAGVNNNPASGHEDGTPGVEPKMDEGDKKMMKSAGFEYDTVKKLWKKKLGGGKFIYTKDSKTKEWIE